MHAQYWYAGLHERYQEQGNACDLFAVPLIGWAWQDVGCCFGQESRKLILDGFPRANIIASDIIPGYWRAAHKPLHASPPKLIKSRELWHLQEPV